MLKLETSIIVKLEKVPIAKNLFIISDVLEDTTNKQILISVAAAKKLLKLLKRQIQNNDLPNN